MKKTLLTILTIIAPIISSCNSNTNGVDGSAPDIDPNPVIIPKDNEVIAHTRRINGSRLDGQTKIIQVENNMPIKRLPSSYFEEQSMGAREDLIGIYLDETRTQKINASQIKNWDSSFHHVYLYFQQSSTIDLTKFFAGQYLIDDTKTITFTNNLFCINYDGNTINGTISFSAPSYIITNITFNDVPISQYEDFNKDQYDKKMSWFDCGVFFLDEYFCVRVFECISLLEYFNLVDLNEHKMTDLIFTQNNNFSINYDL